MNVADSASGRVQPPDLLVFSHQNLAALVPALLRAGLLIFNVVAWNPNFNKAPNQVAHVRVSTVAGVGIRDNEGPEVDRRIRLALLFGHAGAGKVLVLVGRKQCAHQAGCFVGYLAERVARQIRAGIFSDRPLCRGRPATQVNALDAHALDHHRLARRIGAERRDLPVLLKEFAQPCIKGLRSLPRDRVIAADGALLLRHLLRGVKADDPLKARVRKPFLRGGILLVKCGHIAYSFP
jgi:hypothetical protein